MEVGITDRKVDICFASALKAVRDNLKFALLLHSVQCATMAAMIPLDIYVFENANENVVSFFIAATCVTFLSLLSKSNHLRCYLYDKEFVLQIAGELNHVVHE